MDSENNYKARALSYLRSAKRISNSYDVAELQQLVKMLQHAYYQLHTPHISDEEFDKLFRLLISAEKRFGSSDDSPTKQVGSDVQIGTQLLKHYSPMLSLENAFNSEELLQFDNRIKELLPPAEIPTYIAEPKIDGVSISLHYLDNKLVKAVTRGNGVEGEDVSAQIKAISSIPQTANFSAHGIVSCEIRGEVYISKEDFQKINASMVAQSKNTFANARNTVAGSLRIKEGGEIAKRRLNFFAYQLIIIDSNKTSHPLATQSSVISLFDNLGFATTQNSNSAESDIAQIIGYCQNLEKKRPQIAFDIDGAVVKVNSFARQKKIGKTSHHPKWAIAYKFKAQKAISQLQEICFQVGRTGVITPVAKITPTLIGGACITSVSLFNQLFITQHDLRIGDRVIVARSGDVIPYIQENLDKKNQHREKPKTAFPTKCPACHTALQKIDDEAAWKCNNVLCPEQLALSIIHFASKNALDIKNLGEKHIRQFIKEGFIKSIRDLFTLPYEKIPQLDGLGEKYTSNLKTSIDYVKNNTSMHRLLCGLGIRYVGIHTAHLLCSLVVDIREFQSISRELLEQTKEIGPKVADAVHTYFQKEENQKLLQELSKLGLRLDNKLVTNYQLSETFQGKTFLFTGTLTSMNRNEAEQAVKQHGGTISSNVHKQLSYLVAGDKPGSKLKKASAIDTISILSEEAFYTLLEETSQNSNVSTM